MSINGSKQHCMLIFTVDKIYTQNCTDDNELCCCGMLKGELINLLWNASIPINEQFLVLKVEKSKIAETFGKIKMKESARLSIYCKDDIRKEYTIFLRSGSLGGDFREGIQAIPAIRSEYKPTVVREPTFHCIRYSIPITQFKRMIGSFSKLKKGRITIQIYYATSPEYGKHGVGFSISNSIGAEEVATIFEKYGELYEDPTEEADIRQQQLRIAPPNSVGPLGTLGSLAPSGSSSIPSGTSSTGSSSNSTSGSGSGALTVPVIRKPSQFIFSADKIPMLHKFASIHKEGNVIIQYEKGCHLCISGEMGSFGTFKLYLYNPYVQVQPLAIAYTQSVPHVSSATTVQQKALPAPATQTTGGLMSPAPLAYIPITTNATSSTSTISHLN